MHGRVKSAERHSKPVAYVPVNCARHTARPSPRSDRIMNPRLHPRPWMAMTLVPALALLATACTAGSGGSLTPSPTASPAPAASTPAEATDPPSTAATDPPSGDVTGGTTPRRPLRPGGSPAARGRGA